MTKRKSQLSPEQLEAIRARNCDYKKRQRTKDARDPDRKQRKLDTLYMFDSVEISVVVDASGNVWFKGVDLARALELEDPNHAIIQTLDSKYYTNYESLVMDTIHYSDIPNMHPKTTFVNEAGMNLFVIRSRKPRAEVFAEWVCAEVLPSIRKTGKYEVRDPEDNRYRVLNEYLQRRVEELQSETTELKSELKMKNYITEELKSETIKLESDLKRKDDQLSTALSTAARANDQMFSMRSSCNAPLKNRLKDEYVVIYRKYALADKDSVEDPELLHFPYYAVRVQLDSLKSREAELKKKYPGLEQLKKMKLPNSVNFCNHVFEEMSDILERGKGPYAESFRIREACTSEASMLRNANVNGASVEEIYVCLSRALTPEALSGIVL